MALHVRYPSVRPFTPSSEHVRKLTIPLLSIVFWAMTQVLFIPLKILSPSVHTSSQELYPDPKRLLTMPIGQHCIYLNRLYIGSCQVFDTWGFRLTQTERFHHVCLTSSQGDRWAKDVLAWMDRRHCKNVMNSMLSAAMVDSLREQAWMGCWGVALLKR
ncbi:hypothetical protein BC936DRAFT_145587 [Jimgerdemannia flammicorona]|uniref:Uncharacterized protein n=1 Tax=Jimgerdemannia flammicorona TaxID=994334 RepID=A0A433D9M0_9FUNG|nr:hypothetical protein BC936DRAFT_145587 [Jimgerdemannia flammicorona]